MVYKASFKQLKDGNSSYNGRSELHMFYRKDAGQDSVSVVVKKDVIRKRDNFIAKVKLGTGS